jgi:Tfp pilus assembly protein PilF
MADPTPAERLAALRQRWERDQKSRVFLQLAEEYRRAGRLSEAVRILESGLAHHPTYVAAQVVMGRCLIETGDMPRAVKVFERAIALDPTQIVANRLLVDAYLGVDDVGKARQRLDLYRVLNDRDVEIEALEARIAAAGGTARPVITRGRPESHDRLRRSGERSLPPLSPPAFAASSPPVASYVEPPLAPRAPMAPMSPRPKVSSQPAAGARWGPSPQSAATRGRAETPFGDLHRPGDALRIVAAIAAGGVFPVAAPRRGTPAGPFRPVAPEHRAPPPIDELIYSPSAAAPAYEPPPLAAPAYEPPPTVAEPLPAPVPSWTAFEPFEPVTEPAAAFDEPLFAPEPLAAVVEPPPSSAPAAAPTSAASAASATLGSLYLAQGHLDDAEESFEAVLASRPGDAEARAGLAEVRRRKAEAAAAFSEELSPAQPDSAAVVGGLTAKKIDLLRQFMTRMRRGSQPHVS